MKKVDSLRGFDKHLHKLLEAHPEAALEHAKLFAELPIATQLAVMRRRRELSQRAMAKKIKVPQPHVARGWWASCGTSANRP
jgi:hypothetical protein